MAAPPPHPALPNPETPLAFLPPTLAGQFEVSEYLHVATCGMFAWDILTNLRDDYIMLTKHRLSLPTIVYFISRLASIAYITTGTVFTIGQVANCQALQVAIGSTFAAAVPATSLLFFFRVKAVFNNDKYIVAFFSFMWLATLAGSLTVPFAISGTHIGPTKYCINTGVKPFSSAGVVVATVNDTLVFIFISWRLLKASSYNDSFQQRAKSFFLGEGLPTISRSLIQSGQEYYLITAAGNIVTMVMILSPPSVPAVFHAMFTVPNVAIGNAMACRVYRDTKFGRISGNSTYTNQRSTLPKVSAPKYNTQRSHVPYSTQTKTDEYSGGTTMTPEYGIQVSTTVERTMDIPMTVMLPSTGMSGEKAGPNGKGFVSVA